MFLQLLRQLKAKVLNKVRSHYPERASALDFKDAAALPCGHSNVVFRLYLVMNIKRK